MLIRFTLQIGVRFVALYCHDLRVSTDRSHLGKHLDELRAHHARRHDPREVQR